MNVELQVKDLEALRLAAADCGLEFREDQRTHRWFGQYMYDSPLPAGVTKEQLGTCDHALSVAGNPDAYEIGVAKTVGEDGSESYTLRYDFWERGYGLEECVGAGCTKLLQRYGYHAAVRQAASLGWSVASEDVQQDGSIRLQFATAPQWAYQSGGW